MADQSGVYEEVSGESTPTKRQIRAWEVRVDNPLNEDPTLIYRTEKVLLDGDDNLVYREDRRKIDDVSRKFSKLAPKTITVFDPTLQQDVTISGAGVAESIAIFFAKIWNKEF